VSPVDILDDQGMKYSVAEAEEYVALRCTMRKQEAGLTRADRYQKVLHYAQMEIDLSRQPYVVYLDIYFLVEDNSWSSCLLCTALPYRVEVFVLH